MPAKTPRRNRFAMPASPRHEEAGSDQQCPSHALPAVPSSSRTRRERSVTPVRRHPRPRGIDLELRGDTVILVAAQPDFMADRRTGLRAERAFGDPDHPLAHGGVRVQGIGVTIRDPPVETCGRRRPQEAMDRGCSVGLAMGGIRSRKHAGRGAGNDVSTERRSRPMATGRRPIPRFRSVSTRAG